MHTQFNIPNTGGNSLQNASSQADQGPKIAPAQADQPLSQAAAHPVIQEHLAAAPGNMVEVNALSIAEEASCTPLEAAELIQDATQRDAFLLCIAQDPKKSIKERGQAVD